MLRARSRSLVERVGPVLHADRLAVEGMHGVRNVTCGEHTGRGCPQALVDEDAVADGEPGRCRELGAWLDAHSHDDEVAVDESAVARRTRSTASSPFGLDARAQQHPHAVIGVDVAIDRTDLGAENALKGTDAGSTTVTSSPLPRGCGTSAPIQPAPTTTAAPPRSIRSRNASESWTLRR